VRWLLLVVVGLVACAGAGPARTPGLAVYPDVIERYGEGERGGYVVRARAGADLAAIATDPDDVVEGGIVVWVTEAERARIAARGDVESVEILQPAERRGRAAGEEARIDLFGGATDQDRDEVEAWIVARGGVVTWRGPAALRARVSDEVRAEAARLGPVRWVE
jgi:hypothetical protein